MYKKMSNKRALVSIRCSETVRREFKKIAADIGGDYEDALQYFIDHYEDMRRLKPPRFGTRGGAVV
jgi:antitoxin component of RelBE/YafQ-DinJ toxin-antitoxin module